MAYTIPQASATIIGPQATAAADALYANTAITPAAATPAVNALFGAQLSATELTNAASATAAEDIAQGQASALTSQGDTLEANQYLDAAQVSDQNARLERASTGIQLYQEDIAAEKAIGGQQADIAGAGFGGGGSGFYLARNAAQQAGLASSLIGIQGEVSAGGFEQQSLAATAEADAATAAAGGADVLGKAATAAAGTVVANANQTATALTTNALNAAMALNGLNPGASSNPLAAAGLVGRTGTGVDPTEFVTTGSAPQAPSPFTGGSPTLQQGTGGNIRGA